MSIPWIGKTLNTALRSRVNLKVPVRYERCHRIRNYGLKRYHNLNISSFRRLSTYDALFPFGRTYRNYSHYKDIPFQFNKPLEQWKHLFEEDGSIKESNIHILAFILGVLAYYSSPLFKGSAKAELLAQEPISQIQQIVTATEEKTDWSTFWDLIKEEWLPFVLSIIACFGSAFFESCVMRVGGQLLDLADKGDFEAFKEKAWTLLGYIVLQGGLHSLYYSLLSYGSENIKAKLQKLIFDSLVYQDKEFFDKNNVGELMSNITTDVDDVRNLIKHTVSLGVRSIMSFMSGLISSYYQSPKLTLVVFIFVGTAVGIGTAYANFLKKLSKQYKAALARAVTKASESMGAISTVQSFVNENEEIEKYGANIADASYMSKKFGFGYAVFQGLSKVGISGILVGALIYGGKLVTENELSVGDLSSFIIISYNIQQSLGHISQLSGNISNGLDSVERIMSVITRVPKINRSGGKSLPNLQGNVSFSNVNFHYPSRPNQTVLQDVNIDLKQGKTLSIVGVSGSGKSTIAKLILRFYDTTEGSICVDGVDVRHIDPHWLRSQIGVVEQEPVLFQGTILENIAYGNPHASREDVENAARLSKCEEFIARLPNGYNTIVGDRGTQLSGGQKQRVAIARAILKNPRILILDEATSALDSESEHYLQKSLAYLMKGRTTIIIAHRLSTIKNSDEIIVLNNGKLMERGTHDELVKANSHYANMIQQQTEIRE